MFVVKECTGCHEVKLLNEFSRHKLGEYGKRPKCKVCLSKEATVYRKTPRGKALRKISKQRYYQTARGKYTKSLLDAKYYRENTAACKARARARDRRVREATPKWVDIPSIRKIYRECPEGMHVDHMVPIKGKTVCGLHVPWNLQYLSAEENMKKSNKLLEEYCVQ